MRNLYFIFIIFTISSCSQSPKLIEKSKILMGNIEKDKIKERNMLLLYPVSNFWADKELPYVAGIKTTNQLSQNQINTFIKFINNATKNKKVGLYFRVIKENSEKHSYTGEIIGYGYYPLGAFQKFQYTDLNDKNFNRFK